MNSHVTYAIAQARSADLAREARLARQADPRPAAGHGAEPSAVTDGALLRLRRWVAGPRTGGSVERRSSAAA
jgi:hypothetical protein